MFGAGVGLMMRYAGDMERVRRYPTLGGVAAWRIPALASVIIAIASLHGEWLAACFVAVAALVGVRLEGAVVVEVGPAGLTHGFALGRGFLGPAGVLPWRSIDEVQTRWRAPRDFSLLETIVTGHDGRSIRLTSRMGLSAYCEVIGDIVRHAPEARRTGLTDELLAEVSAAASRRLRPRHVLALGVSILFGLAALAAWA